MNFQSNLESDDDYVLSHQGQSMFGFLSNNESSANKRLYTETQDQIQFEKNIFSNKKTSFIGIILTVS